jgi:hypothetical protein
VIQTPSIPTFPECSHPIVRSLAHYSDQELLTLFQRHPDEGQYFATIFCRYSPMLYTLIRHSARSPVQADYLFATGSRWATPVYPPELVVEYYGNLHQPGRTAADRVHPL